MWPRTRSSLALRILRKSRNTDGVCRQTSRTCSTRSPSPTGVPTGINLWKFCPNEIHPWVRGVLAEASFRPRLMFRWCEDEWWGYTALSISSPSHLNPSLPSSFQIRLLARRRFSLVWRGTSLIRVPLRQPLLFHDLHRLRRRLHQKV